MALMTCLLPGCTTKPVTVGHDLVLMPESDKVHFGQACHQQIIDKMRIYDASSWPIDNQSYRLVTTAPSRVAVIQFMVVQRPPAELRLLSGLYPTG